MPVNPFENGAEKYDAWYERHRAAFDSELAAFRELLPEGEGLEVGVGTGRFSEALGISTGVEPSAAMAELARHRGIEVVAGVGESIPFDNGRFDFVLLSTTLCFLDEPSVALAEAHRVLRPGGVVLVGFIDSDSELGRAYRRRPAGPYREARFHSPQEVEALLHAAGFGEFEMRQTLFSMPAALTQPDPVRPGHGTGGFVVIRGRRQ